MLAKVGDKLPEDMAVLVDAYVHTAGVTAIEFPGWAFPGWEKFLTLHFADGSCRLPTNDDWHNVQDYLGVPRRDIWPSSDDEEEDE